MPDLAREKTKVRTKGGWDKKKQVSSSETVCQACEHGDGLTPFQTCLESYEEEGTLALRCLGHVPDACMRIYISFVATRTIITCWLVDHVCIHHIRTFSNGYIRQVIHTQPYHAALRSVWHVCLLRLSVSCAWRRIRSLLFRQPEMDRGGGGEDGEVVPVGWRGSRPVGGGEGGGR
jgi:hypothetical protein